MQSSVTARRHRSPHSGHNSLGAVMIVTTDWKVDRWRKCNFNKTMDSLVAHWRPHNANYPVILIDTKSWLRSDMVAIRRKWSSMDILFLNVGKVWFGAPQGISEAEFQDRGSPLSDIRYKRMCHFFFAGFTQVPLLMHYHYLFRLDDDSCLLDNINYDIFEMMRTMKIFYAYRSQAFDPLYVTYGLNNFAEAYMNTHNLTWANIALRKMATKSRYSSRNLTMVFHTNFEIIDTQRYLQSDISNFIAEVVKSQMIFHRRWGDAPLRHLLAQMFWREEEVLQLCEFDYQHSTWPVMEMCEHRTIVNRVSQGLDP